MTRTVKNWKPEAVEEAEVAPHRYLWNADHPVFETSEKGSYGKCRKAAPYQPGDVVFVDRDGIAVKARVLTVDAEANRYGDWREGYHVQLATKAGYWSRHWIKTYPGTIQRGYKLVGLAPDLEGKI